MDHVLLAQSSVLGPSGRFRISAPVYHAALSTGVRFIRSLFPVLGSTAKVEMLGPVGTLCLTFGGTAWPFSAVAMFV